MSHDTKKIFNEFIKNIKKLLGKRIKKIILYGSYARGDFNEKSDIDVMILTDLADEEISQYSMQIWEMTADIEIDTGIVISPLLRNIDNFNSWADVKPFYTNIINEGVIING